jgi:hypothetical protein
MKKLSLLLFAIIASVLLNSCSKEDTKVNEPTTSAFTVYKNETGDANADALQAQNTDSKGTLNFYGAFDSENNPSEIRTLTYQKANNDTIVNLIIDPLTNRLASSYFSVKGVKSPVVLKFDYIEGVSNAYNLSYYNYNWENKTSELLYAARVETNNTVASSNPFFANRGGGNDGFKLILQACTIGFVTVKIIVPIVSGLIKASATVIAAAVAAPIVTTAAVGAVLLFLIPKLGAAELDYTASSSKPPVKTPIINPVSATGNPTPNLQTSSCVNTNMTFRASMDAEGSIMISEVEGGQSPHTCMVTSGFQQSQVFPNQYKDGSYVVGIKDANGCVSVKLVSLKREIDTTLPLVGTWKLESQAGIPVGQFENYSNSDCPNIVIGKNTILNETLIFGTNTFTLSTSHKNVFLNLTYNPTTCAVTGDGPDTEIIDNNSYNGTYTVNGSNIQIIYNPGIGGSDTIIFLSNNRIKTVEENEIYVRQ